MFLAGRGMSIGASVSQALCALPFFLLFALASGTASCKASTSVAPLLHRVPSKSAIYSFLKYQVRTVSHVALSLYLLCTSHVHMTQSSRASSHEGQILKCH